MDILIKDMGMPLMCDECPCYNESDYSCNATGRGVIEYRYDGHPDNCPLVEIPTPHGRLIDADELIAWDGTEWGTPDDVVMYGDIWGAPTIIEAEE